MIQANPKLQRHSLFYTVFGADYAASTLMFVRRLTESNSQGFTLYGLLEDIKDNAQSITRKWYKGVSGNSASSVGKNGSNLLSATFDKYFAGDTKNYLDPKIVDSDLERLRSISKRCKSYADKRIAHLDKSPIQNIPKYSDLDDWITELQDIFWKYNLLLTGGDMDLQVKLSHDWKEIFRVAWLNE